MYNTTILTVHILYGCLLIYLMYILMVKIILFVLQLKGNIDETKSIVEIVDKFNNHKILTYPSILM